MLIGLVLLLAIGYGVYHYSKSQDDPMDIASQRLANGEILKNEFDDIKERITRKVQR